MALYTVATGQPPAAADLNQAINLLSGASSPTDSQLAVANRIRAQLTGATATSGLAGSTVNGPPASGTFVLGDLVVDTGYGCLWVCTTAGTPGTWRRVGGQTWSTRAYISTGAYYPGPIDPNTGFQTPPPPTTISQTFFTRSGRVGFDVVQTNYEVSDFYPYLMPGFSGTAYGITVPVTGTYLLSAYLDPSGPTGGVDLGLMFLKNGAIYQYGTEFLSYGVPMLRGMAIMHCVAGDLVQMGAYAEGQVSPTSGNFGAGWRMYTLGN